ncbi:MAG: excinuclease ABC subunit UvrC [Candidatus Omnitrophica bacterium]|nr:excinuclease ABC subunit UvrC [Candidatus Omnitrophota bacterium]MCM8802230.1 excinuclease ABC subunit UvrC [Candidatus Omnitrophota bacterium]
MNPKIKFKLKNLPNSPGVYLMKNKQGEVIYVGKASSLSKRVRSYFTSSGNNTKVLLLSEKIYDFEVIPVFSEAEALILENQLIKKYQPKYNTNLKDDKSYPFLKITKEEFPSVQIVREEKQDDAIYFGPFTNKKLLKETLRFLRKFYPVRNCKKDISSRKVKLCIQYHIGRCSGPCEDKINKEEYQKLVEGIIAFFEGKYKEFEKKLKKWMLEEIKKLNFEEANKIKKRLFLLNEMKKKFPVREEEELYKYGEENILFNLSKILKLDKVPNHIEGYDISNISGKLAVGSKVSFVAGIPYKDDYRRYKIKTVEGIDDYGMLREVLTRRFDSKQERKQIPDLILVDGGKGQLKTAISILRNYNLKIPVISLAKKEEKVFVEWQEEPIVLPSSSPELQLLQRIRNEAHRFAISYHRNIRIKNLKFSFLDEIEGVGEKIKKKIITNFPDLKMLTDLNIDQIKKLRISEKIAKKIIEKVKEVVDNERGKNL